VNVLSILVRSMSGFLLLAALNEFLLVGAAVGWELADEFRTDGFLAGKKKEEKDGV
jgi:hypothetical protein